MEDKTFVIDIIRYTIIILSAIMLLFCLVVKSPIGLFYAVTLLWLQNIIFACQKLFIRSALFCFHIAFFVFLLGSTLISYIETGESLYYFDSAIEIHTYFSLYISLLLLYITYCYLEKKQLVDTFIKPNLENEDFIYYIRLASLLIIYVTFIPYLLNIYEKIDYVANTSYSQIYLRDSSNLPTIVQKVSQLFVPALFVYLGTMPSKLKAMVPIIMYVVANVWSVRAGARANFARSIMVIFFYFLARDRWLKEGEKRWIGKKELIGLVVLVPFLILFMYNIGHTRWGSSETAVSMFQGIKNFFIEQGVSLQVIEFGKRFQDQLPDNSYVIGPLSNIYKRISFLKSIFNFDSYGRQTVESALYGTKFSDALSYLAMPVRYLQGYGLGSSYIAEVYQCYSYIGVGLINILYGIVFQFIDRWYGKNYWVTAFLLFMLYRLIYAPRAQAVDFISETFIATNVFVFLGIYIVAVILLDVAKKRKYQS